MITTLSKKSTGPAVYIHMDMISDRIRRLPAALVVTAAILAACGSPSALPENTPTAGTLQVVTTAPLLGSATAFGDALTPASPTATLVAAATSRGPALVASDPGTTALTSGGLQLIEFFRFT